MQRSRVRQPGRLEASDATGWPCSGTGTFPNHTGPASCVTVPVLSAYLYVACTPRWQSPGWGLPLGGWPGPSSIQRLGWRLCDPVTGNRPSWGPPRGFARVRYQPRPLGSQIRRGYMLRLRVMELKTSPPTTRRAPTPPTDWSPVKRERAPVPASQHGAADNRCASRSFHRKLESRDTNASPTTSPQSHRWPTS